MMILLSRITIDPLLQQMLCKKIPEIRVQKKLEDYLRKTDN